MTRLFHKLVVRYGACHALQIIARKGGWMCLASFPDLPTLQFLITNFCPLPLPEAVKS